MAIFKINIALTCTFSKNQASLPSWSCRLDPGHPLQRLSRATGRAVGRHGPPAGCGGSKSGGTNPFGQRVRVADGLLGAREARVGLLRHHRDLGLTDALLNEILVDGDLSSMRLALSC